MSTINANANAKARVNGKFVGSVSNIEPNFKDAYKVAKQLAKDHYGAKDGTVIVDIKNNETGEIRTWEITQKVETRYSRGQKYFPLKQTSKIIDYKK